MKALKESDDKKHKDVCTKIREDGAYVEAGENDNLLVQKVSADPGALGVLGYSFLEEMPTACRRFRSRALRPPKKRSAT